MSLFLVTAVLLLSVANGANDNFKGVATLYGSRLVSYRTALAWATVSTLAGSLTAIVLARGLAKRFSGRGLVPDPVVADPTFLLAVALGAALAVLLATRFGLPISTTHALTGGLVGAGLVLAGPGRIAYAALGTFFVLPLLLSPVLSLLLAATLHALLGWVARGLGISESSCICATSGQALATNPPGLVVGLRLDAAPSMTVAHVEDCARRRLTGFSPQVVLDRAHLATAGAVGFARGLNDTPKIVALLLGAQTLGVTPGMTVVGIVMALGGVLGARRVAETLSFGVTAMSPAQGFTANLVTALLVTLASPLGLPVSTTHVSCGALFGIGLVTGQARWGTIAQIVTAWVTTLPVAAALAALAAASIRHARP